jgi:hypothetical protein
LAVLQFALLASFLAIEPAFGGRKSGTAMVIAAAVVLCAFVPHLFAITTLPTGQELAAGALCAAIIGVWLSCRAGIRWLRQRRSSFSRTAS